MKIGGKHTGHIRLSLLLLGLPLLVYLAGIRGTVSLWHTARANRTTIENARLPATKGNSPGSKPGSASGVLQTALSADPVRQEELLASLSDVITGNRLTVERYTPYLIGQDGETDVYVCEVLLRGDFKALTRLVSEVEKEGTPGGLVSTNYSLGVNNQTRKTYLQMTLTIQQLTTRKTDN